MAPISVTAAMVRRWPRCNGVSRTRSTSRRRSLSTTSPARVNSVEVTPVAISDRLLMEHGATIIPMVWNEPLAIEAATSSMRCTNVASALTCATFMGSSCARATCADRVMTRCVSSPRARNAWSVRTPNTMPEAPQMPTIRRFVSGEFMSDDSPKRGTGDRQLPPMPRATLRGMKSPCDAPRPAVRQRAIRAARPAGADTRGPGPAFGARGTRYFPALASATTPAASKLLISSMSSLV